MEENTEETTKIIQTASQPTSYFTEETLFQPREVNGRRILAPRGNLHAKLMLILSHPGKDDLVDRILLSGEYLKEVLHAFAYAGLTMQDVYITSMVKCGIGKKSKPSAELIEEFRPTLDFEINLVKPRLIMTLGAEVFKCLMKANIKMGGYFGEVIDSPYGKLIANYSPGMIITQDPKKRPHFQDAFLTASRYANGNLNYQEFTWEIVDKPERNIELLVDYINKGALTVGYDAEWSPGKLYNGEEVLHTFQYSCEPNHAIILDISKDGKTENLELLNTMRLLLDNPKADRLGWNIRADDKRLTFRGIKPLESTIGFDGMKAVAFIDSRFPKGLETGIKKFTNYEPYYIPLNKALRTHKLSHAEMCQLKFLEPDIFWKYCAGDAVSHRTACIAMREIIQKKPKSIRDYYFKTYLPLSNYFLDMESYGVPIDTEVMEDITNKYSGKFDELKEKLQGLVSTYMPEFNPASSDDKKELLYKHLGLNPPYYTKSGKSPKPAVWYAKQRKDIQSEYQPSTNNKSLSTLKFAMIKELNDHPDRDVIEAPKLKIISTLLDLNRVNVFANKFLSKRGIVETEQDDDDEPLKQSYWASLCNDSHIHPDFFECLNNYRSSCAPNVQNPASKVLSHIPKIFVPNYDSLSKEEKKEADKHVIPRNLRHIFYAGKPGFKWTEVDVAGADLAIGAFLSKDRDYINDILSGGFHLKKAREYFRDPTITKDNYSKYVSAKAITFRVAYTSELLSAAVPIQSEIYAESGIFIPEGDIAYALTTWERYQQYMRYREACKNQVKENRVIENARGFKYYFEDSDRRDILAGWLNESLAYPIASELALFMWDLAVQMKEELQKTGTWMKYIYPVNSVHDAMYWVVHEDLFKDNYFQELCKYYFTEKCRIATGDRLGMEMTVSDRWKGKDVLFNKETKWNFETNRWDWKD